MREIYEKRLALEAACRAAGETLDRAKANAAPDGSDADKVLAAEAAWIAANAVLKAACRPTPEEKAAYEEHARAHPMTVRFTPWAIIPRDVSE